MALLLGKEFPQWQGHIKVYRTDRLCGGAHEKSGIPAPIWLHGWRVHGLCWCRWWWCGWWGGWCGGLCGVGGWGGGGDCGGGVGSGWVDDVWGWVGGGVLGWVGVRWWVGWLWE